MGGSVGRTISPDREAKTVQEITALKADIDKGLADVAAGRVRDFDAQSIIERGRKLLSGRERGTDCPP